MSSQSKYEQDVYISYSVSDQLWVDNELLPRLDKEKITYKDHERFMVGQPKLDEIERAIEQSRRTLLILTPQYLQDNWRRWDSLLVISYGLEIDQWLTVPVIKTPCEIPPRLNALVSVDLSTSREQAWRQLIDTLSATVTLPASVDHADLEKINTPRPDRGQPVIKVGLQALQQLMSAPEVREAVNRFRDKFKSARDQIQILADYKDLHDALHTLQSGCFEVIHNSLKSFPDDEDTCNNLVAYETKLGSIVSDVQVIIKKTTFVGYQNSWVRNLTDAKTQLAEANKRSKVEYLKSTVWNLRTVIGEQPTRINDKLVEAARDLKLAELVMAMAVVREKLERPDLDTVKIEQFAAAIDNLADMYHKLKNLISDHDRWQEIDIIQRRVKNNFTDDLTELENSWQLLYELTKSLYDNRAEEWAISLKRSAEALDVAVNAQNLTDAKRGFFGFYSQTSDRFIRVDKALKKMCDDLRNIGDSLSLLLGMLQ
jgi:hypothetical protein